MDIKSSDFDIKIFLIKTNSKKIKIIYPIKKIYIWI